MEQSVCGLDWRGATATQNVTISTSIVIETPIVVKHDSKQTRLFYSGYSNIVLYGVWPVVSMLS